jgi:hypothetical protein
MGAHISMGMAPKTQLDAISAYGSQHDPIDWIEDQNAPTVSQEAVFFSYSLSTAEEWVRDLEDALGSTGYGYRPISSDELMEAADRMDALGERSEKEYLANASYQVRKDRKGWRASPIREKGWGDETLAASHDLWLAHKYHEVADILRGAAVNNGSRSLGDDWGFFVYCG